MSGPAGEWRLAIDTATRQSTVALGRGRQLVAESRRETPHRHGQGLLEQLDELLRSEDVKLEAIGAIGVGIGPGSFTGLRVGMATAKTLAYGLGRPLVGVPTSDALVRAATSRGGGGPGLAVVLPAGARDRYLIRPGSPPVLVAMDPPLREELGDTPSLALDLDPGEIGDAALERGRLALEGLAAALLELTEDRLVGGPTDDVAALVPAYVALPRGIAPAFEGTAWSPDLR